MTTSIDKFIKTRIERHATKVGARGREQLWNTLSKTDDPWSTISKLQESNSLGFQRCQPAVSFLEVLENSSKDAELVGTRHHIHLLLLEKLRNSLDECLSQATDDVLLRILFHTIRLVTFSELKSLPISVMKKIQGKIPNTFLKLISTDKCCSVLQELPMSIRRQVWIVTPSLFVDTIDELSKGISSQTIMSNINECRRADAPCRQLSDCIGNSLDLFTVFANYCTSYAAVSESIWGAVMRHVMMCSHEAGQKIAALARLYELAWQLDQSVRTGSLDEDGLNVILKILKPLIMMQTAAGQSDRSLVSASIQSSHRSLQSAVAMAPNSNISTVQKAQRMLAAVARSDTKFKPVAVSSSSNSSQQKSKKRPASALALAQSQALPRPRTPAVSKANIKNSQLKSESSRSKESKGKISSSQVLTFYQRLCC